MLTDCHEHCPNNEQFGATLTSLLSLVCSGCRFSMIPVSVHILAATSVGHFLLLALHSQLTVGKLSVLTCC